DAQAAVPVTRIPMATNRPWAFARAWRALQPHLEGADVLHTHAFSTLLPFVGRRRPAIPWVHTEHWSGVSNPGSLKPPARWVAPVLSRALRLPDVVVAVSEHLAGFVRAVRSGATVVVPNLVS